MSKETFGGDKKVGKSILHNLEQSLIKKLTPKVPSFIETYHLTLSTLIWSVLTILFFYLAKNDIRWLYGASVVIVFQYITDILDGAVGRYRNTGLVKWGFYFDHLLDFIFISSIIIGWAILFPTHIYLLFFALVICTGFMMSTFLSFSATNEFQISHLGIGPTEVRILLIITNMIVILVNEESLTNFIWAGLIISFIGLCIVVYRTQKNLWQKDMIEKRKNK